MVAGRGALPVAGPVACGDRLLWVMTTVDIISSSSTVTNVAHMATMLFARNRSWTGLVAGQERVAPRRRACGVWWPMGYDSS